MGALDLWESMSHQARADFRAIENMHLVTEKDGNHTLTVRPERRPDVANATAAMAAG